MTEYELDRYCAAHPYCDCNCVKCPAFAEYQREQLGRNEEDDEEETN